VLTVSRTLLISRTLSFKVTNSIIYHEPYHHNNTNSIIWLLWTYRLIITNPTTTRYLSTTKSCSRYRKLYLEPKFYHFKTTNSFFYLSRTLSSLDTWAQPNRAYDIANSIYNPSSIISRPRTLSSIYHELYYHQIPAHDKIVLTVSQSLFISQILSLQDHELIFYLSRSLSSITNPII